MGSPIKDQNSGSKGLRSGLPLSCAALASVLTLLALGVPTARADVSSVALGGGHSCALTDQGIVSCWGNNAYGQLGDGTTSSNAFPVLVKSGGVDSLTALPAPLSGASATQVSVGADFSCALISDSTVRCWGHNDAGQLGNGSPCTGDPASCFSSTPTRVVDVFGEPVKAIAISVGGRSACAILGALSLGKVACWGDNSSGQLGRGSTSSGEWSAQEVNGISQASQDVDSGSKLSVAADAACVVISADNASTDGKVNCWGANAAGQLGDGTTAARWSVDPVSPKAVVGAVAPSTSLVELSGFRSISSSAAPEASSPSSHTCGIRQVAGSGSSGEVRCWGANGSAELGAPSSTPFSSKALKIEQLGTAAVGIASGATHSCAVLRGGAMSCWGSSALGKLGNGVAIKTATAPTTPSVISGRKAVALLPASSVSTGSSSTCAVIGRGRDNVYCWGEGYGASNAPRPVKQAQVDKSPTGSPSLSIKTLNSAGQFTSAGEFVNNTVQADVTADGGAYSYMCSLIAPSGLVMPSGLRDGGDPSVCTLPLSIPIKDAGGVNVEGRYVLRVQAFNAGGASPATSVSWSVDSTPPAAPDLTDKPLQYDSRSTTLVRFQGERAATFLCALDSGPEIACSVSGWTLAGLPDGDHSISVRQFDRAGNASEVTRYSWKVDKVPPAPPVVTVDSTTPCLAGSTSTCILNSPNVLTGLTRFRANLASVADAGSPVMRKCKIPPSVAWVDCQSSPTQAIDMDLASSNEASSYRADYQLQVKSVDAAGNESEPVVRPIVVDSDPPLTRSDVLPKVTGSATAGFTLVILPKAAKQDVMSKFAADTLGLSALEWSTALAAPDYFTPMPTSTKCSVISSTTKVTATSGCINVADTSFGLSILTKAEIQWIRFRDKAGNTSRWIRIETI